MTKQAAEAKYRAFSMGLFNAMAGAMTEASGSPWLVAAVPDAEPPLEESFPVRSKLSVAGSVVGDLLLEFRRTEATELLSKCSRQPIDEFGREQVDALLQLLNGAIREFVPAARQDYGTFTIEAFSESEPLPETAAMFQMTATDGDSDRLTVMIYLSPELGASLSLHAATETIAADNGNLSNSAVKALAPDPVNLKLVMDVELSVTLRFGQRQLTLREVLELTTGSVVELDRHVEEPVELLLEGRVIAKGEAVVIDGNYGIRVTEVCERMGTPWHY